MSVNFVLLEDPSVAIWSWCVCESDLRALCAKLEVRSDSFNKNSLILQSAKKYVVFLEITSRALWDHLLLHHGAEDMHSSTRLCHVYMEYTVLHNRKSLQSIKNIQN